METSGNTRKMAGTAWGTRGRGFESRRSDQKFQNISMVYASSQGCRIWRRYESPASSGAFYFRWIRLAGHCSTPIHLGNADVGDGLALTRLRAERFDFSWPIMFVFEVERPRDT